MITITGAKGRIGSHLLREYPDSLCYDVDSVDLKRGAPPMTEDVIHLAAMLDSSLDAAASNIDMMINVLRACQRDGARRVVIASSIRFDPELVLFPTEYYSASKIASEALLKAWCAEDCTRIGVALRFGYFSPGGKPLPEHEVLRLTERGLLFWVRKALAVAEPGFKAWIAMGDPGDDS